METTSNNTLTYSSELMKNYLHAGIMDAEDTFAALQDAKGNAILLSIGTDGVLYGTQEVPAFNNTSGGTGTAAGWVKSDLSSACLAKDFPGGTATCKTFAVNQNSADSTIGLAMVATQNGNDLLYLCMGNSAQDSSWLAQPAWIACPFMRPSGPAAPTPFAILKVFISETSGGQYIVVDLNNQGLVQRYYLTQGVAGMLWNLHALAIDLDASQPYQSCLGRAAGASIDGIYTEGATGGSPQFMYCPLWNAFGSGPASPVLLELPASAGGLNQPQAFASFRNGSTNGSTDLFATAADTGNGGMLYYFPARMHGSPCAGLPLLDNQVLADVATMHADLTDGVVTVWWLNSGGDVYYASCPYTCVTQAAAWSLPVLLLADVDMVSPYVNKTNGGNTIFASDGDASLYILSKSPASGMWSTAQVALPQPDPGAQPVAFSSYTTRLRLADANGQPMPNAPLMISASSRTGFYVNNLYTVLDPTPVAINTDQFGVVTIIESAHSLHCARLTVGEAGAPPIVINPMDKPFNQAALLNSSAALQAAVITCTDGSTRPLVAPGVSGDDLATAAEANQSLATAYGRLSSAPPGLPGKRTVVHPRALGDIGGLAMDLGDLVNWLESGVEAFVSVVEDAATGAFHFVARIAGQAYLALLDGVEKVVGAIVWIYNQIKTLITDLILFLEFLFAWKDILATHKVMKNILVQVVQEAISNVGTLDQAIGDSFSQVEAAIGQWAGVTGYDQTPNQISAANPPPPEIHSAPANLGTHHFQSNANDTATGYVAPSPGSVLDELENLITEEGDAISLMVTQIQTQLVDQFGTLSISQIVEKLAAIVANFVLDTAQNILTTVADVLAKLAQGVMDLLNATIDIPVLSWLYKEISGNDLSVLDLFCLIGAIPVNLVYKVAQNAAPFPHDAPLTGQLIDASSLAELRVLFNPPQLASRALPNAQQLSAVVAVSDDEMEKANFVLGILAGIGTIGMVVLAGLRFSDPKNKKLAAMQGVANLLYIAPDYSPMLQEDTRWFAIMNDTCTSISALKGLSLDVIGAGSSASSGVECALNTVWNVPVIANIVYTRDHPSAPNADKYLAANSAGNFAFDVGGILAPFTKFKPVVVGQCLLMAAYGIAMVVVGGKQI